MEESNTSNILYDLLTYSEWTQDPDRIPDKQICQSSASHGTFGLFRKSVSLVDEINRVSNWQLPCKFAAGELGKVVAILLETILEIRTSRDEYITVVGKATVAKDPMPQWRRMAWSPDSTILAVSFSNGTIHFYDLLGSNLFNIPSMNDGEDSKSNSLESALACMMFIPSRTKTKWSTELLVINYAGNLQSYFVSPTDGFLENHAFTFSKDGIASAAWHPTHNLIYVSSLPDQIFSTSKENGLCYGLTAWRLLNDYPYYKLAIPPEEELEKAKSRVGLWNMLPSIRSIPQTSIVFRMQISLQGKYLACLHTCGSVSIWNLPGLSLSGIWKLEEQPNCRERNIEDEKTNKEFDWDKVYPIDINWWPDEKLIIARRNGAISVCELSGLRNILGDKPESLAGATMLSTTCTEKGFLALESDFKIIKKRHQQSTDQSEEISDKEEEQKEDEEEEEEKDSLFTRGSALVQSTIYYITDSERFRPERKLPKLIQRTYRLIALKSTTPEELFSRKIDNEEYTQALALAHTYNLDCDRVYQRQWRNSPVSVASIHDYLSKISKCSWVLQECCERVPETLSAAKELLEFGLKMTENQLGEIFKQHWIAKNESVEDSIDDDSSEKFDFIEFVKETNLETLSEEEKRTISARIKLLKFSDRLHTYQLILKNAMEAASTNTASSSIEPSTDENNDDVDNDYENFDKEFYDRFRHQSIVVSAVYYAQKGDYSAVKVLFTYHGSETLNYWLSILENFPETLLPSKYSELLPECSCDGDVFEWNVMKIRDTDWCEVDKFNSLSIEEEEKWDNCPSLDSHSSLTAAELSVWYRKRIHQIESSSHLVDPALDLMRLARKLNITGLDDLYHQLLTLDMLVYELGMEDLTLEELEKLSPLEKALLLVKDANEENFVENLLHRVVPYVDRHEGLVPNSRKSLLSQLFSNLSSQSLTLPLKLFQYLRDEPENRIASTMEERISLTLDCLYTNSATDEIGKAFLILSCLPDRSTIQGSTDLEDFRKRLEVVESELKTAVILKRHGQPKPLLYIHNNAHDLQTVQNLVLRISRATANKVPPASETEWNQLFTDILELQKNTFSCMSLELCYELYASTVMASGDLKIIRSAMKILCCCAGDQHRKQISFDRSVDLVLQAAREYFDSASSLYDPGMQNAKACLNLIIEENPQIQEELDLIWSLQLLSDFNVNLLPMQVRLCPNRMRLIENCLQSQPTAYRNHQKLLVLADKLRICSSSEHERKGSVLVRVAEAAFSAKDYSYCCTICNMLVNDEHAVGWEICQKLGQCSEFTQIGARQHLISFALLHCSPQHLQDLIKTRCDLEIESTQQEISKSLSNMEIFSSLDQDDEFVDALTSPTTPMKEFLPQWTSKLQSTTNLLSKMTSSNFWKNSFNLGTSEAASKPTLLDNSDFKKQGFPSFYSPLHPGCHRSALTPSFLEDEDNIIKSSQRMKQLTLVQKLLQSVLLEQETQSPSSQNSINNVLIQASQLIMSEDCQLGLGYLFSLSNISVAEQCFSNLPQTQVSLQLALYLYSIKQIIHEHKDAFSMLPEDVVNAALNGTKHNEDVHGLIQKYKLKLENFVQTEKMKELNCGVNLDRFTKDTQYKYDSILGLAICQEWDKVELALELGALYGVSGLEVALNHVVAMLLTGDPQLAIEHISDNRLASLLQEDSQLVIKRLEESVFSNLNGTNHQLMIAYYTVLQSVAEKPLIDGILPKDHIKLLKKVKATSSAIDYRSLLRSNLLTALRPALNRDSAANIVKLFKALPTHLRGDVTTSQLYTDMMISDFFYNCLGYSSENKSVSHFELLKSFWTKVSADDLLNFVKSCVFSRKCAEQLDPDMRKQLLSDVIAFCQLQQNIETHGTTQNTLENWLVNLSNTWDSIQFSSVDDSLKNLLCELDVSCGDEESIPSIVESAIMNRSVPFEIIEKKLLSKGLVSISEMITKLLKLVDVKDVESMSVLLDRINSCLDRDLRDEEWPSLVQELASNSQLPPKLRVLAASLMQKVGETGTKEKLLMITIAVLGHPVDSEDIVDENARYSLFTQLLKEKKTRDELMVMQQLLCCWPPFSDAIAEIHPHLQLIENMILLEYDNVHEYISKVFVENKVDETSVEKIVNRLASLGGHSAIIWLCLITESPNLHSTAIRLLSDFQGDLIPEQIVKRTVELQLTSKLVQSKIYSVWVESLLVLEDGTVARSAIGQLKEAGYLPEAGHLWFSVESIPRPLRTFSASLISLAQRLTKN